MLEIKNTKYRMKALSDFINENIGKYKHVGDNDIIITLDVYDGVLYDEEGEWHRFSNAEKFKFEDGYKFKSYNNRCEIEDLECKLSYPGEGPEDECYFIMDIYPKDNNMFMEIDQQDINNVKVFCANIKLDYKKLVSDFIKPQVEKWLNYRGMKFKF
jgi:hypothetical protein